MSTIIIITPHPKTPSNGLVAESPEDSAIMVKTKISCAETVAALRKAADQLEGK